MGIIYILDKENDWAVFGLLMRKRKEFSSQIRDLLLLIHMYLQESIGMEKESEISKS